MVFSGEDKELIKINLLKKNYRPLKPMTEFPEKNWKRNRLDRLLKKLCETRSNDRWEAHTISSICSGQAGNVPIK